MLLIFLKDIERQTNYFLFYKNVTWLMFITFILIRMEYIFATLSTTVTINTMDSNRLGNGSVKSPGKAFATKPDSLNPMPRTHMVGLIL